MVTTSAYNWNDSKSPYETLGMFEYWTIPRFQFVYPILTEQGVAKKKEVRRTNWNVGAVVGF